jgi:hypothetical protein
MQAPNLTLAQIRNAYPNQWVLLGNPILNEPEIETSIISQLVSGIVIFSSPDKHELAKQARESKKGYESTTLIYTGIIPKGRRFCL